MFFKVQLLCQYQDLRGNLTGYDHDSIAIRGHNVTGIHFHSIAYHRDACAGNTIMPRRSCRINTGSVDRESNLAQIGNVAHASINYSAGKVARRHRRAHQTTHAGDVHPILQGHNIDRVLRSLVNCSQHRGERIRIVVFFFHHLYGDGVAGELCIEDWLHVVGHVHALTGELLNGI